LIPCVELVDRYGPIVVENPVVMGDVDGFIDIGA